MNGASVQPSEGQQHGMKMTVQAEQMKVCMLKSLLLREDKGGLVTGCTRSLVLISSDLSGVFLNEYFRVFNDIKNI